jgi:hypothetical protein
MIKHCDGNGQKLPCPHPDDCTVSCMFNDATETRKIKPYPVVPDDIEPVDQHWYKVGRFMLCAGMLILVVFFVTMFMTGVWIWGMLV